MRIGPEGIERIENNVRENTINLSQKEENKKMKLEDFETISNLGEGSQGVVKKVLHKKTNKYFAIKCVKFELEEKVRKKLILELQTLNTSHHKSIVTFYNAYYQNGTTFILLGKKIKNKNKKIKNKNKKYKKFKLNKIK